MWCIRKYKKKDSWKKARNWLWKVAKRDTKLFVHWKFGILPTAM